MEEDVPGEHGGDAGDLLLLVHAVVAGGVGLEVEGHLPGHARQHGEQVAAAGLAGQHVAEGLQCRISEIVTGIGLARGLLYAR